jgi:multimeric flavodoxin WrbA
VQYQAPYHSHPASYGHITKLTEEVVAGAKSTGAQVDVFQIPETLSDEVLAKVLQRTVKQL